MRDLFARAGQPPVIDVDSTASTGAIPTSLLPLDFAPALVPQVIIDDSSVEEVQLVEGIGRAQMPGGSIAASFETYHPPGLDLSPAGSLHHTVRSGFGTGFHAGSNLHFGGGPSHGSGGHCGHGGR